MVKNKAFYNYEDAEKWVMSQINDPLKESYHIRLMNSFGGVKLEHPKYLAVIIEREKKKEQWKTEWKVKTSRKQY